MYFIFCLIYINNKDRFVNTELLRNLSYSVNQDIIHFRFCLEYEVSSLRASDISYHQGFTLPLPINKCVQEHSNNLTVKTFEMKRYSYRRKVICPLF